MRGVQHQRSAAYMARQQAKRLTKEAQKSPGNSHVQRNADQAWDEAEEFSEKDGHPYEDRHGVRQHPEKDSEFMVSLVLKAYAERRGLEYDNRTSREWVRAREP